jgi:hypothetical protein
MYFILLTLKREYVEAKGLEMLDWSTNVMMGRSIVLTSPGETHPSLLSPLLNTEITR